MSKVKISPVLAQYFDIKDSLEEDTLLFFQLGDFYEIFFEDAVITSKVLGIQLTKRGKYEDKDIPMCGVPIHSYVVYANRLVKEGYKVALCNQLETPAQAKIRAGSKAVIKREVFRVLTKGTVIEEDFIASSNFNFLLSLTIKGNKCSLAWIDITTNNFFFNTIDTVSIANEIHKISPSEIILSDKLRNNHILSEFNNIISYVSHEKCNLTTSKLLLNSIYGEHVVAYNNFDDLASISISMIIDYVQSMYNCNHYKLKFPISVAHNSSEYLKIDGFTNKSLELLTTLSGEAKGSVFHCINNTYTAAGSRLLSNWLSYPSKSIDKIMQRYQIIEWLLNHNQHCVDLQNNLISIPDVVRSISRLSYSNNLVAQLIKVTIFCIHIRAIINIVSNIPNNDILYFIIENGLLVDKISKKLIEAINTDPHAESIIRDGYLPQMDNINLELNELYNQIDIIKDEYIIKTGIKKLKISRNNILGYYIEIPSREVNNLAIDLQHKQSLASSVRYTSNDLLQLEADILRLESIKDALLQDTYNTLSNEIFTYKDSFIKVSDVVSYLDVMLNFTNLAKDYNLVKPIINNTTNLKIIKGRHLVVESILALKNEGQFIANDCLMDKDKNFFLITGPNMSGKSTYLRQNALIIILAHIGSFVPAESAEIGLVDAIFSRVGAADELFRGKSTFMVEMLETASILNNATDRSFIIMDEIGRGTSTHDGYAIAQAVAEYICSKIKARTLFATHFHDLAELSKNYKNFATFNVKIIKENNKIIFMHALSEGSINNSYGIDVAILAGIPEEVTSRARNLFDSIESKFNLQDTIIKDEAYSKELSLPLSYSSDRISAKGLEIKEYINNIKIDDITPKQAMDILYNLKAKYDK